MDLLKRIFALFVCTLFIIGCTPEALPSATSVPTTPAPVYPTDDPSVESLDGPILPPTRTPDLAPLDGYFPPAGSIPDWEPEGEILHFTRINLFEFMDGQAEGFFVYGFEQLAAQNYKSVSGQVLRVEIYQMGSDADAAGIFTGARSTEDVPFGNEGSAASGQRITFWQNRYYVQMIAGAGESPSAADLEAFALEVQNALPKGGQQPTILMELPQDGLKSSLFFREELSIQNDIWLGGENILALSPFTNGALGRYEVDGQTLIVLLVDYPDESFIESVSSNLLKTELEGLLAWKVKNNRLALVIGEGDIDQANQLIDVALK